MKTLEITAISDDLAIVLPKEICERLNLRQGDHLYLSETAQGIVLTTQDPEYTAQLVAAERVMQEDRDALERLAQ